jgi:anti-sigma regulatory factor (Ser/Thr protein kinase)
MLAATMAATHPSSCPSSQPPAPGPRLTLEGRLEDLAEVWPWIEALARHYSIPARTEYAIHLCLEEALSNVVRHGYTGQANRSIVIECASCGAKEMVFTIEDQAPPFDPLAHPHAGHGPAPVSIAELEPGGQGIRLMRKFADRVAWERLPNGNRLTFAFSITS